MIAAFRICKWLGCACHDLDLAVGIAFDALKANAPHLTDSEILSLVAAAKGVTTYGKRTE